MVEIIGIAVEAIPAGTVVSRHTDLTTGGSFLCAYQKPATKEVPAHVLLTQEAVKAGLVVTQLMPQRYSEDSYVVQIWTPEGTLWAEGRGESAESIAEMIENWKNRD